MSVQQQQLLEDGGNLHAYVPTFHFSTARMSHNPYCTCTRGMMHVYMSTPRKFSITPGLSNDASFPGHQRSVIIWCFCRDCTNCNMGFPGTVVLLGETLKEGVFPAVRPEDCCAACTVLPDCAAFSHVTYAFDGISQCTLFRTVTGIMQVDIQSDRGVAVSLITSNVDVWTPPSTPPPPSFLPNR
jgi:hypothetical protein